MLKSDKVTASTCFKNAMEGRAANAWVRNWRKYFQAWSAGLSDAQKESLKGWEMLVSAWEELYTIMYKPQLLTSEQCEQFADQVHSFECLLHVSPGSSSLIMGH